jgi:hypothetical protein
MISSNFTHHLCGVWGVGCGVWGAGWAYYAPSAGIVSFSLGEDSFGEQIR